MKTALTRYANRREAGTHLGEKLAFARAWSPVVFGVPQGGMVVAGEVAAALGAPLDVLVASRLYSPRDPSVSLGALAETGAVWLDPRAALHAGVSEAQLSDVIMRESLELERQARRYREGRGRWGVEGRTVILVDEGLVTGATARAAVAALRTLAPRRIILAVALADAEVADGLRAIVDALIVGHSAPGLGSLPRWYEHFPVVSDGEVMELLTRSRRVAEPAPDAAVP